MGRTGPGLATVHPTSDPSCEHEFGVRSLRGNVVLRWEYRQGSALYLAWQQRRNRYLLEGSCVLSHDQGELMRAPPENVFVVNTNQFVG